MTDCPGRWFDDLKIIGQLDSDALAAKLRELGSEDLSSALTQPQRPGVQSFDIIDKILGRSVAWKHTAHAFGFIPEAVNAQNGPLSITHAGDMPADESLRGSRIRITLDRLRVADYPGSGVHRILFDFYGRNQAADGAEDLHFNATYRVMEGESAGIAGYPIFNGLSVGDSGVAFRCFTVNVKNDDDEKFLAGLESDAFRAGLQLSRIVQPAIAPLTDIAVAVTRSIATRNRNVPVQDFYLGLDFSKVATRARLACGSYVVVQIPESLSVVWDWNDWTYDLQRGRISQRHTKADIPYNYIVLGVSRDGA